MLYLQQNLEPIFSYFICVVWLLWQTSLCLSGVASLVSCLCFAPYAFTSFDARPPCSNVLATLLGALAGQAAAAVCVGLRSPAYVCARLGDHMSLHNALLTAALGPFHSVMFLLRVLNRWREGTRCVLCGCKAPSSASCASRARHPLEHPVSPRCTSLVGSQTQRWVEVEEAERGMLPRTLLVVVAAGVSISHARVPIAYLLCESATRY